MSRSAPIRFRMLVDPFEDEQSAYHCDMQFYEEDLNALDSPHGLDDFIEKFVKPGLTVLLDQFQQPFSDSGDLMRKTIDAGRSHLPRAIKFYREKHEMHLRRKG